jgi:hypothetical protein
MSIFGSRFAACSLRVLILASLAIPVAAQIDIGSLSGVVTDPQGGLIQGAQVTAVETSTHTTHLATSNNDGVYTILSLPQGVYDLTVTHAGFQTLTNAGIALGSGENKKVDAKLAVGKVTEQIEVTGTAPVLETREGQYSLDEGTKTLEQLPLEISGGKRDATQYMTALPGFQQGNGFNNQVLGSVSGYNEVYVDGTPEEINAAAHGATRNFFSAEGVDEIKVVTTPMADLGNVGGVAVSFVTKAGTNQIHGSGYGFIRNTAFDATCDQFCSTKQADHQGEYGFQVGGPVYIPHVYDGRNKTFWWFNWGHFYYNYTNATSFFAVPTDAMKGGDFSAYLGGTPIGSVNGQPVYAGEIFNPQTGQPFSVGGSLNMIPTSSFSSVASKYQGFLPEPTSSAIPVLGGNNYQVAGSTGSSPDTYYQIDIDQNIGTKDRISGAYWYDTQSPTPVFNRPAILEVASEGGPIGHFVHMNWSHSFTSNLVHSASFGFDRNSSPILSPPTALTGAQAIGQVNPLGPCTPSFQIAGGYMSSNRGDFLCYQAEGDNNFEINDNWSWAKGKHLFKWGFNSIRFNANFPFQGNLSAGFLPAETSAPVTATCPAATCASLTGNSYASFLIGAVDNAETKGHSESSPRIFQYGFYFQDEFKVTRKLSVTYALRYDVQPFPVERHNYVSQFEATEPNPGCNGCPGAVGFLGFGPGTLNTRRVVPNQYWATNFGPKLGFAYQVQQNTVVRGAITLADGPVNQTMAGFANEFQQGYFPTFNLNSTGTNAPVFYLDNGFPLPSGIPLYNDFNPTIANGGGTDYFGADSDRAPRVLNTHFGIEHQFRGRVVVGVHYAGAYVHGIITGAGQPQNQLDYNKYRSYGITCLQSDITQAAANCPGISIPVPYAGYTGTVEQALRPFPQYQDIENESAPTGWSTYSAGQITAKKDFDNGLSFFVGYTLSREMSNLNSTPGFFSAPPQDAYNPKAEKAVAYADMPHQVILNYTYQLPVGRGKRLNVNSAALNEVVGGWSIAGIHTYESGTPQNVQTPITLFSQPSTGTNGAYVRANLVPGQSLRTNLSCSQINPQGGGPGGGQYINPNAFALPGPLQFGDAPQNFSQLRNCPYFNENITVYKNFRITEKVNFRFGTDFFNIFNRHTWGSLNTFFDPGNNASFGKFFGVSSPRSIQFNGRITF